MKTHTREQRLWVVFTDQTEIVWLRFLKRGFRHCFVLIHDGEHWISVDPLSTQMEIAVQNIPLAYDLPSWLTSQGHTVLRVRKYDAGKRPAPMMFFSCVEAVKRILGVRNRNIFTPWQLYCHLQRAPRAALPYSKGVLSWEV